MQKEKSAFDLDLINTRTLKTRLLVLYFAHYPFVRVKTTNMPPQPQSAGELHCFRQLP